MTWDANKISEFARKAKDRLRWLITDDGYIEPVTLVYLSRETHQVVVKDYNGNLVLLSAEEKKERLFRAMRSAYEILITTYQAEASVANKKADAVRTKYGSAVNYSQLEEDNEQ